MNAQAARVAAPDAAVPARSARGIGWDRRNYIPVAFIALLFITGMLAPWIAPFSVARIDVASAGKPPSLQQPFGTDDVGRDVLTRLLHGTTNTIGLAAASVAVACSLGALLGLIAGYAGRWPELAIMRTVDVLLAFPSLLLALTFVTIIGPSAWTIVAILGVTHAPRYIRLIRGTVLSLREREFVYAAQALGASPPRIVGRHLLPNAIAPLIVYATLDMGFVITAVAGLSFLGFGLGPPAQSWGQLLAEGRAYTARAPWMAAFPGLTIAATVLSFNLLGDALRDWLDPRLRRTS